MPQTGIEPVLYHYNGILSPARLPVPPLRQIYEFPQMRKWAEVDSNHRSKLQQIYSLSPLATRESTHVQDHVLTDFYYSIGNGYLQVTNKSLTIVRLITGSLIGQSISFRSVLYALTISFCLFTVPHHDTTAYFPEFHLKP